MRNFVGLLILNERYFALVPVDGFWSLSIRLFAAAGGDRDPHT